MSSALDFGYAQARIQARYAALPPETEWQRLAATRSLGAYLEEARVGPLGPWLKGFSAVSGAHDMERGIRALAWEQTLETAGWSPRSWRPAVRWVAWLPYLGAFEELARNRRFPSWALQDPRLRDWLDDDGATSTEALQRHGPTPLIAQRNAEQLASSWMLEWKARWPAMHRQQVGHLMAFVQELGGHLQAFRQEGADTAWDLRRQLRDRLRLRLHQRLLEPVAVFLYLALVFLDLERLRGELVHRCLFSRGASTASQVAGAI